MFWHDFETLLFAFLGSIWGSISNMLGIILVIKIEINKHMIKTKFVSEVFVDGAAGKAGVGSGARTLKS